MAGTERQRQANVEVSRTNEMETGRTKNSEAGRARDKRQAVKEPEASRQSMGARDHQIKAKNKQ